jgi:hypothetical protein
VAALAAETLDLADRHSLDTYFAQGVTHVIEAKWLYYRGDQFHTVSLCAGLRAYASNTIRLSVQLKASK